MKYLKGYKVFESERDLDWDKLSKEQKMGKLLHLYSSIPLQKEKAQYVISAIVRASGANYNINDRLDIKPWRVKDKNRLHDKLRFYDYFNSLLSSKDVRGFNFEGLIAGLYNGKVQPPKSRPDVILDSGERISVKFLDSKGEAPVLASVKEAINKSELKDAILTELPKIGDGRIYDLFRSKDPKHEALKSEIFDLSFPDVDLFLIAYPNHPSKPTAIDIYILSNAEMKDKICNGYVNAPKFSQNKWQLRLSSRYRTGVDSFSIDIPEMSDDNLDKLWSMGSRKWSKEIFGDSISKRMRTDVIEDVIDNKEKIADNLEKDIESDKIKQGNEES